MIMTPRIRKVALTAHLTFSIGWIGAVAAFLPLAVVAVTGQDVQRVRAACLSMGWIVPYVVVPLAFAALLTGLVLSLGTRWGLFRHYWVLLKLLLTVVAAVVLLVQLQQIGQLAEAAADPTSSIAVLRGASRSLVHAVGGLVVLLVVQVLGVYKPLGMTPYGRRRQHEERTTPRP
jgi:hypothetical protein